MEYRAQPSAGSTRVGGIPIGYQCKERNFPLQIIF